MSKGLVLSALSVSLGVMLVSTDAEAFEFGTPAREHPHTSAQNFALELRIGPYIADVDDEPALGGRTPYSDRFGRKPRIYAGLEFDWQMFRIPFVGTLGPGVSVGTVSMSRDAMTKENPPRPTKDEYSLTIYPIYLAAVLRADVLWRELGFPLVPYAKLGLAMGIWKASNASGTSVANDVSGRGISFGTHLAGGVMFPLNFFDRGASRNMDNFIGINNTYLYAEYYWLNLNGLAQSHALYVGTSSWVAGLTFEF